MKLRTKPVRLPTLEQLESAIEFLAAYDTAFAETADILDPAQRKRARAEFRTMLRSWYRSHTGLDHDGIYALQATAKSVKGRRNGIANDRSVFSSITHWLYWAPPGRPFSRVLNGKCFTPEMVAELDNGQLPNVLETAGGWCSLGDWSASSPPIKGFGWKLGTWKDVERANAAAKKPWWEWASDENDPRE